MTTNQLNVLIEKINHPDTIIRVYPTKCTVRTSEGEWIVSPFKNDMSLYRDETHIGKQGRGYIEWKNGDFNEPVEVTDCEILYWNRKWVSDPENLSMGGVAASIRYCKEMMEGKSAFDMIQPIIGI